MLKLILVHASVLSQLCVCVCVCEREREREPLYSEMWVSYFKCLMCFSTTTFRHQN